MNPNVTIIQPTMTAEQNQKIRVAAYCRVSSDSADQLNSYMAQMRYYENFLAHSETETLVSVYADEGITGTRMDKRDDFQRMLKDCRRGKIDRIISKSVSRFARNTKECLTVIRELKSLGITVMFEKEGIDTAKISDEMMITIMGGLAQEESTSISSNMRWSAQKRMANGTYKIARPPFGFDISKGVLTINEPQAKVVRKIFQLYISGYGVQKIAEWLKSENVAGSNHQVSWTADTVRNMLKNERYIGDALFQKNYVTEILPHMKKRNNGEKQKYYVTETNPPIVEKEVFEAAQRLLKERHKPYSNDGHTMSGKIFCARCGATYKFKKCGEKCYWTCRTHDKKSDLCESRRILESKIYGAFIILYNKLKRQYAVIFPPLLSQLQELKNKKFSGNQQYMETAKKIAEFKEQIHVLTRLKTKGFLDDEKYFSQTAELHTKIEKHSQELRKIAHSDDEDELIDQIKEIASIIENGTDLMTEFDEVMFASLIEKMIVKDQTTLEFYLYGGLKFTERL